jgi:hypothetical protein
MEQKLMAFWKYDLFPYVLCGKLKKIKSNGFVEPVGHQGRSFRPIKILPLEEGKIIKDKIDKIVSEDNLLREKIRKESMSKLVDIIL